MGKLTPSSVVVDPALTNVSIKYTNDSFIADQMLPVVKVAKQTGKYFKYDKANLRVEVSLRAAGSPSNEVDFGVTPSGVFSCNDHALKGLIDDEIVDQAESALDPLIDETETITEKLMIEKELAASALLTNTSNLTQNTTLAGVNQWSDFSGTSDPIAVVRTGGRTIHNNSLKKANTLMVSKPVFDYLVDHPKVIARVQYSQLGVITEELLARLFNVERVLVGETGYNSAKEGQTDAISYVWGKDAVLAYVNPKVTLKSVTLGLTFTYGTRKVKRWYDEDREGTYVRVGDDNYDQRIVCVECGYLIKSAVA